MASLIAATAYSYWSYRKATEDLIIERDRQVALLNAVRLRDELNKLASELQGLARSQSLYLGLTERQRLFLRGASQRLRLFDGGVILMDNTGRVRATVPERWDIMGDDWSSQEFFKEMLVESPPAIHFSPVLNVGPDNSPVIVMSVPVLGENREMVGVLSGLYLLGESQISAFYANIVRLHLTGSGDTYIVDSAGRIIYDSGYERIGETIEMGEFKSAGVQAGSQRMKDLQGHEVVAAFAPVPGTDWMLMTETDWSAAMAPVQRFAAGLMVLLAMGMVIPTLGVVLLARGQRSDELERDQDTFAGRLRKQIRQQMVPEQVPLLNGWDIGIYYESGNNHTAAYDMYDFLILPDGRLMVALATATEKGLAVVHLLSTLRACFRTAAGRVQSAGQALTQCSSLLCPDVRPESAISSVYSLLDPANGLLQIASAGICAPMLWRGGELIEMREEGTFLGQDLNATYANEEVLLEPGESIIFYSPGVLGVLSDNGDAFGPERVRSVLKGSSNASAQSIVDALCLDLTIFADKDSLHRQDITIIALSRSAKPHTAERRHRILMDDLSALGETDL